MLPNADRRAGEGDGPHDRLVIRGITVIDGTGAPPRGPMDIVVEQDRIREVASVGFPKVPVGDRRPAKGTKEIDGTGMFLMPGFIDLHVHCGGGQANNPEYVYKLWLAHGVTTVRGVPCGSMDWDLQQRDLAAKNQIVAPRIFAYHRPFSGEGWDRSKPQTPETAREWVRWAAQKGIDGLKLGAYDPEIMEALLDEAKKAGLGSTAHLDQMGVGRMTARDAARLGLGAMTHYYGLFESLYKDQSIQSYPVTQNYNDEYHRFGQVARNWDKIWERGSEPWNDLIKEWVDRKFVIDPTMTIYSAGRDVMRMRNADWHDKYTIPSLWEFFQPNRIAHGAYWFDWTTEDEVAWKKFYQVWMTFLNDYKNAGGRVTTGSDSGFIYQTYGFGYTLELEMLQEAGFHPLEVVRSATLFGAQALHEPKGKPIEFGIIRPGLKADFVITKENPLQNFKTLYVTGAVRLNDQANKAERVGGIDFVVKDGIVYDAKKLAADVASLVEKAKTQRRTTTSAQQQQ
ncbi:MAG: amidohydrolase [Acidobacteria bacterium]|nr:amidohydrolase [Acidobacteriota bacterium]